MKQGLSEQRGLAEDKRTARAKAKRLGMASDKKREPGLGHWIGPGLDQEMGQGPRDETWV